MINLKILFIAVFALFFIGLHAQTENTALLCADGIDNDNNGLIDCDDPACQAIGTGNGCSTCTDALSFADVVLNYSPGCSCSNCNNSFEMLGVSDNTSVSLGGGGFAELGFVDNFLTNSGDATADLWVFEVGPQVEDTDVALRPADANTIAILQSNNIPDSDGDGYYEVGEVEGSTSSIDLDALITGLQSGAITFDAIKLIDTSTSCSGGSPGADIDAVCALSSIPAEVCGNGIDDDNDGSVDEDCVTDARLQVEGNIALTDSTGNIQFRGNNSTDALIDWNGSLLDVRNNKLGGDIALNATDDLLFSTGGLGDTSLFINEMGRVGIGMSTPSEALEVDGSIVLSNLGRRSILFKEQGITKASMGWNSIVFGLNANSENGQIILDAVETIAFRNGTPPDATGNTRMIIVPDGKVGIGTNNPTQLLDVNGDFTLSDGTGRIEFLEKVDPFDPGTVKAAIDWDGTVLTIENNEGASGDIALDADGDLSSVSDSVKLNSRSDFLINSNEDIFINAVEDINMDTPEDLNLDAKNIRLDASSDVVIDAGEDIIFGNGTPIKNRLIIDQSGKVIVGELQSSTDFTFNVNHSSSAANSIFSDRNGFRLRNTDSGDNWSHYVSGMSGNYVWVAGSNTIKSEIDLSSGNWVPGSDKKLKTNIQTIPNGQLQNILKLRPTTYRFKGQGSKRQIFGLIAQEVQQIYPDIVLEMGEGEQQLGISYTELIPILVSGIQEQQAQIEAKDERIETLEAKVEELENLKAEMSELKTMMQQLLNKDRVQLTPNDETPSEDIPALQQNIPNPFNGITTITYYVPKAATQAFIQITDANGKVLERFEVVENGHGTLEIDATRIQTGQYFYSLILDGEVFESKQMILAK